MAIISVFKYLAFLLFFLYIPGKLLLDSVKVKPEDRLIKTGLNLTAGMAFITLLSLVIRGFGLSFSFLWIVFAGSLIYLLFNFRVRGISGSLQKTDILLLSVLFTGVITQNLVLFRGGWQTAEGLIFPSLHDTMWNIAIAGELFHHFPPQNPAVAGILLKNNHYFYPLFISIARSLTGIDVFDLYFRFTPILVSFIFGIGIYSAASIFIKNIYFRIVALFLGYFSGNAAFLVPLFLGAKFDWKGNTFFADQPFDQIINPYSVVGFSLFLFGIYCLSQIARSKKREFGYGILGGLLLGIIYGFKSFGGIIAILALAATFIVQAVFYRKFSLLTVTSAALFLFAVILLLTTDFRNAALIWAPGWLLSQMMTDKDKLNLPRYGDLESFYRSGGKILGFIKIKTIELAIYIFGNLGTRLLGFCYIFISVLRKASDKKSGQIFLSWFIAFAVTVSFSIPLLFNLRNSTFNIIQFTPYGLLLSAILSAYALEIIYDRLKTKNKKLWGILAVGIFLVLSIPVNFKNILSKIDSPKDLISSDEINALQWLRDNTAEDDKVLIDPHQFSQDSIYTAAISERRIYLSSPSFAAQTGLDPKTKIDSLNAFFEDGDVNFLTANGISYVYLLKNNLSDSQLTTLSKSDKKNVFENNSVIIWERAE